MENRRSFIYKFLMVNAGAIIAPSLTFASESFLSVNPSNNISGILPVGILIDSFEALCKDESLTDCKDLIELDLTQRWLPGNYAFSGFAISQFNGNEADLLQAMKKLKEDDADKSKRAVSMLLGKVVYDTVGQAYLEEYSKEKDKVLFDAHLLQRKNELPEMNKKQLTHHFNVLLPRMITRLHTLKPDELDGDEWVVRVSKWRKANLDYLKRLAKATTSDIKESEKKYFDALYEKAISLSIKNVKEKILECKKGGLL